MRYRICHRTSYDYAKPVFESFNEVRLQPLACATQTLLDFDLVIQPPATVIAFRDYYGNAVHDFGVPYLHERLVIEATSDIVTHAGEDEPIGAPGADQDDASLSLATLSGDVALSDEFAEFLGPSSYIVLLDDSAELARRLLAEEPDTTALGFLYRAVDHVRSSLEYRLGTTTVNSSVAEVLAGGSGVCQDFAHVLISLCRNVGLPARYVSGYLGGVESRPPRTPGPRPTSRPTAGSASTRRSARAAPGRHVIVGIGRDYADVAVLSGTYQGGGQATLDVQVACETLGGSDAMAQLRGGSAPIARLVAIQNLGAMRQFQRGTVMTQAMGGLTQTLPLDSMPPPREQRSDVNDVPTEQPRQQQQTWA